MARDLDTFYKLRSAVTRHRVVVDTTRELEQSSDRALAEMGLARGDIASVANGTFRGEPAIVRRPRR